MKSIYSVSVNSADTVERVFNGYTNNAISIINTCLKGFNVPIFLDGRVIKSKKALIETLKLYAIRRKRLVIKVQANKSDSNNFERVIAVQTFANAKLFESSIYCRRSANYTSDQLCKFELITNNL